MIVNDDDNVGAIFFFDAQSEHESWPDPESVERETSSLTGHEFPNFGTDNKTTHKYFEQEFEMCHKHGIEFGGYRGACWRSRTRVELYDEDSLSTDDDAKFMFYYNESV